MPRKRQWTKQDGKVQTRWEAVYRDHSGRQRTRMFRLKWEAQAYEEEQRHRLRTGEWTDPDRGLILYRDYVEKLWWPGYRTTLSPGTRINYRGILDAHIVPTFGRTKLVAIGQETIQAWVNDLASRLSGDRVRQIYDLFQRSLRAAQAGQRIRHSPCISINLPEGRSGEPRALTPAEVARLIEHVRPRYRAMVLLAAWGGLRLGELAGLKRRRVDLARSQVTVAEVLTWPGSTPTPKLLPKSDAGRRTVGALPQGAVEALATHLREFPTSNEGYIFASPEAHPMRKRNFYHRVWHPAREAADLDGLHFHELRHTAASIAIAAGADILTLARRLGHAKPSYTMDLYGHWYPDRDDALRDRLTAMMDQDSLSPQGPGQQRLTGG